MKLVTSTEGQRWLTFSFINIYYICLASLFKNFAVNVVLHFLLSSKRVL